MNDTNANNISSMSDKQQMTEQQKAQQLQALLSARRNPATDYFQNGNWNTDSAFLKNHNLRWDYPNFDALQPLYPGLYVIGATPGLGKTTFVQQMADQIATQKHPVLFFSFEQTANELYGKSLARRTYWKSKMTQTSQAYSSMELRRGKADGTQELADAIDSYTKCVENYMDVIECTFGFTVETIIEVVKAEVLKAKTAGMPVPVVIIDYLQVIHASTVNGRLITEPRASIDHIITSLKQLQKDNGLVMFVISSLNRMNYMTPVDYESFKESGSIEFTADVMLGMTMTITTDDDFEHKVLNRKAGTQKDRTPSEKRLIIAKAQAADVRDIEIRILKNRFGKKGDSLYFEYVPKYDAFRASDYDRYLKHKYHLRLLSAAEEDDKS